MLATNRSIRDLNLTKTFFRVAGATALARALETNTTLMTLDLMMNICEDAGTPFIPSFYHPCG
jgi:hypothetical protein